MARSASQGWERYSRPGILGRKQSRFFGARHFGSTLSLPLRRAHLVFKNVLTLSTTKISKLTGHNLIYQQVALDQIRKGLQEFGLLEIMAGHKELFRPYFVYTVEQNADNAYAAFDFGTHHIHRLGKGICLGTKPPTPQ